MLRTKFLSKLFFNAPAISSDVIGIFPAGCRSLYSSAALGLDGFLQARERTKLQVLNAESFKTKMQEFVKDDGSRKNLIFTEDLKNMVHIAEKGDLELLSKMVQKFCSQSKETRFGNFVFGPVIMRLLHHLKEPDSALEIFKHEDLNGFFDQLATYQILMDMLFESKRYDDILTTFDIIKSRQVQGGKFPKHVLVLTFAACYKINTKASLEYATKIYQTASEAGQNLVMRKGTTFFAALAINQDQPQIALEVLSNVKQQNYLTVRTLKALALAKMKRFDDVLVILRAVLEVDNPTMKKQTFPLTLADSLKPAFAADAGKEVQADFQKVIGFLENHQHISQDTLDDILCSEIQMTVQPAFGDRYSNKSGGDFNYERRDNSSYERRDNSNYERRDNSNYVRRDRPGYQRRDRDQENDYPARRTRPGLHELN